MNKKILLFVAGALMLGGCDDLFEPGLENFKDVEQMYEDPEYAQGFLMSAYRRIPGCSGRQPYDA